jgi:hypothetical protein
VRGYNGQKSTWYQAAVKQKAGRITAAGIRKAVAFAPVEGALNDRIDDAIARNTRAAHTSAR